MKSCKFNACGKKIVAGEVASALVLCAVPFAGNVKEAQGDVNTNYVKVLQESLYFFDANMCGGEVDENSVYSWRSDCHLGDEKISYNGRSVDVSGGYHDAGDHVKFGLPQSYSATVLGISYLEYKDIYDQYGLTDHYKTIMDHFVDYFKKCTILNNAGEVESFCYQVGEGNHDHDYWGTPEKQDSVQGDRSSQGYFTSISNPCTDIVSETAAALCLYSINFNDNEALDYAKKLFDYAKNNNKNVSGEGTSSFYDSKRYADDYVMAAAMLYKKTGNNEYANEFKKYCDKGEGADRCNELAWFSWDDVSALALSYGHQFGLYNNPYGDPLANALGSMQGSGNEVAGGYRAILEWGSARYNCNMQGLAYLCGDTSKIEWANKQMDYILGDDNLSFVCGHTNYELRPHHRAASGFNNISGNGLNKQAHVLVGALVGGYDKDGNFENNAESYKYTEVAMDYNAGLVLAASGAAYHSLKNGSQSQSTIKDTDFPGEFRESIVSKYAAATAAARGESGNGNDEIDSNENGTDETGNGEMESNQNGETESNQNSEMESDQNGETESNQNSETGNINENESQENNDQNINDETVVIDAEKTSEDINKQNAGSSATKDTSTSNVNTSKENTNTDISTASRKTKKYKIKINLKNKKKYKFNKKVVIKAKAKIRLIKINGKRIKIKKNRKKITFKLKKYRKYLRKKKLNKILIKDKKGNKKIIRFRIKK